MRRSMIATVAVAVAAGLAPGVAAASSPSTPAPTPSTVHTVAKHLDNPRGLDWSGGHLYVAEAGRGGKNCDSSGSTCVGLTGRVARIDGSNVTRLSRGLVSVAGHDGTAAEGPVSVSVDSGHVYAQMFGAPQEVPQTGFPNYLEKRAHHQLGQLGWLNGRMFAPIVGVGAQDYAWSQQHKNLVPGQFPDANPNDVYVHGNQAAVADAGSNTLTLVRNGHVSNIKFIPTPQGSPTDSVITCVTPGPDHAWYVGELLGGNYAPGHARIWKVMWDKGHLTKSVWARGLTTVQGCGFDKAGNFYATEFQVNGLNEDPTASPNGDVVQIAPDRARTKLGVGGLYYPSGFAAGAHGSIYVSNCSIAPASGFGPCPDGGEVVRIDAATSS